MKKPIVGDLEEQLKHAPTALNQRIKEAGIHTKTWPYGTTRKGSVVSLIPRDKPPHRQIAIITDDANEGHIIAPDCFPRGTKSGDVGTLTFVEGGPAGGYWKFTKDA
jgi:hypothetical protein